MSTQMLTRVLRWFLIAAPLVAGILLIIFGTAGGISVAFGVTLIGIALMVWMWNWFVRMSFAETTREKESDAREERAQTQLAENERAKEQRAREAARQARDRDRPTSPRGSERAPGTPTATGHGPPRRLVRRPRRPQ